MENMNKDTIQGNWKELKGHAKQFWSKLTDDDLKEAEGNIDVVKGKLQKIYGYTREQAENEFNKFMKKTSSSGDSSFRNSNEPRSDSYNSNRSNTSQN